MPVLACCSSCLKEEETGGMFKVCDVKGTTSQLWLLQRLVEKARSPAALVQCKHGLLCVRKDRQRGRNRKKECKRNMRWRREQRERDDTNSHSMRHAVLRIRLSVNLINMASLISIWEYSTEGHPLCSPPPSSHVDYTYAFIYHYFFLFLLKFFFFYIYWTP